MQGHSTLTSVSVVDSPAAVCLNEISCDKRLTNPSKNLKIGANEQSATITTTAWHLGHVLMTRWQDVQCATPATCPRNDVIGT